ncbi:MAG: 2,3-bisphosphoglycerate-independent phosphoglycerate mutase [Aquificota bacterium]|nr:2,3-bisphosphoglycerate-independent phosphoglycerate mutase [Aquificota bacterium]
MGVVEDLVQPSDTKIVLVVLDGIGGLPVDRERTELEIAETPNLDRLARVSATGLHIPVDYGVTPGSGPGHLALFGYDPIEHQIGRGVLEALGLGLEVRETDVAVRGNYATVEYRNGKPVVVDRRAGRIPTEENRRITERINREIGDLDGVEVKVAPGAEHRVAVLFRFPEPLPEGSDRLRDTDPQSVGKEPLDPVPETPQAERVARVAGEFLRKVSEILRSEKRANFLLLRGFSQKPKMRSFKDRFGLRACCVAVYPMYKGLASLVGMEVVSFEGNTPEDQVRILRKVWNDYDFFFLHIKKTDSFGEDGNWRGKVEVIEEFDRVLPQILELGPDVLAITGDHSTPSKLKGHSWHPVPLLIYSPYVLGGTSSRFTERECLKGELGIIPAKKIMNLLLANALRLKKFGA